MDSHFLWELIHLRSQLQRRSEKIYVLSNSTADFRNAFLKTIRQIIRESVRNMSIPLKGLGSMNSVAELPPLHRGSINSQTLERPKQQVSIGGLSIIWSNHINDESFPKVQIMQGSQTLGKTKKSKNQRHSAGNIDYDNMHGSQEADDIPAHAHSGFRIRSKTVGDTTGELGMKRFKLATSHLYGAALQILQRDPSLKKILEQSPKVKMIPPSKSLLKNHWVELPIT